MEKEQTYQVQNLKCGGCANTIKNGVLKLEGIEDVTVDKDTCEIHISTTNSFSEEKLADTLKNLGYPLVDDENSVLTKAKSFVSCAVGKVS